MLRVHAAGPCHAIKVDTISAGRPFRATRSALVELEKIIRSHAGKMEKAHMQRALDMD